MAAICSIPMIFAPEYAVSIEREVMICHGTLLDVLRWIYSHTDQVTPDLDTPTVPKVVS